MYNIHIVRRGGSSYTISVKSEFVHELLMLLEDSKLVTSYSIDFDGRDLADAQRRIHGLNYSKIVQINTQPIATQINIF